VAGQTGGEKGVTGQIEQQAKMPQNALCFLDMLSPSVLETGRNPLHLMILEHCDTQTHCGEPEGG